MTEQEYNVFIELLKQQIIALEEFKQTILSLIEENDKEKRNDIANNSLTTLNIWINGTRKALEGGDVVT